MTHPAIHPRKVRICWTCSDHVDHAHTFRCTAWLCGQLQRILARFRIYIVR